MTKTTGIRRTLIAGTIAVLGGAAAFAQTALAELGLSNAAAAEFVMNEVKGPATNRQAAIAVAGTRAFLKLPRTARAAAATRLFAGSASSSMRRHM